MSGGITQLVSQGIQDKVLVGDPQVSFLKQIINDIQIFLSL